MNSLLHEEIIKTNVCTLCNIKFPITNRDNAFYKKLKVPEPEECPQCREQKRLVFRNDRYYYKHSCDLCKAQMLSVYDPKRIENILCYKCWWSDKWDAKDYAQDFDPNKPFFDQYKDLLEKVPKLGMINDNGSGSENCEYTYDFAFSKNAYLVIASWYVHDCYYGFQINYTKDSIDNYFVNESELMYNSAICEKCYSCQDCIQCSNSTNCIFGYDLKGCKDCLFSAGLRNKQYCIWNKQYPKEEFFKIKKELNLGSWQKREESRKQFKEFIKSIPRKYANLINCEKSTGNNLVNSKNAIECFNQRNLHDCKWMSHGTGGKDSYECWSTSGPELCYNCITPDDSYNVIFSVYCWKSQNISYSDNCHSSHDLFGCVSMKREKYCILNKQYSEAEYKKLKENVIKHMAKNGEYGKFFSSEVTLFAYNETPAQECHPLKKDQAKSRGYRWADKLPGSYNKATISWDEVPDNIVDTDASMNKHIFSCTKCEKNYRILLKELTFYTKHDIPLPRLCVDCRYNARKLLINPRKLWDRECAKCQKNIKTSYAPERTEKVYCEKCYL